MKCPKCNNENVRNIGKKVLLVHIEEDGKISKGKTGRNRYSHENEKKYKCLKCGWRSE